MNSPITVSTKPRYGQAFKWDGSIPEEWKGTLQLVTGNVGPVLVTPNGNTRVHLGAWVVCIRGVWSIVANDDLFEAEFVVINVQEPV